MRGAARRRFPALRYVLTSNAGTNAHTADINDRLGFVAFQRSSFFQVAS